MINKQAQFELDARVNFQDYWRATYSYMFLVSKFKVLLVGAAGGALIFLLLTILYPQRKPAYQLLVPLAALALLLLILYLNTKYLYSTKKFLHANVRYVFSDQGVDAVAPLSPGWRSWDEMAKAFELKHDFVLFYSPERMYPIPKRCFQNPAELLRFREMLRAQMGSKARLR